MAHIAKKLPIVVILGATGAGKSKAALEIAIKFNGEIISADAMQIYKGLDIVTNKVSKEEQRQVPHHMIDIVSPLKSNFNIHNFQQMVIPKIESLLCENKLPVIVGGTNYYIESILWDLLIGNTRCQDNANEKTTKDGTEPERKFTTFDEGLESSESKDRDLSEVPVSASVRQGDVDEEPAGIQEDALYSHVVPGAGTSDSLSAIQVQDSIGNIDSHTAGIPHPPDSERTVAEGLNSCIEPILEEQESPKMVNSGTAKIECHNSGGQGSREVKLKHEADVVGLGDKEEWSKLSSVELHARLKEVDPQSALRLHPHNKRKILRALEVYMQHQQPLSEMLRQQHSQEGASHVSGPLRYPRPCVIWVQCQQTVLDERTDWRVDQMLADGLLTELEAFHSQYNQNRLQPTGEADYTLGIFQSIGFKEFHKYLLLTPDQRKTEEGAEMFSEGLKEMKLATRRYARRQKKWIVGRFLKRRGLNVPPVYAVDSSIKEEWTERVQTPAYQIVESFIQESDPPCTPLPVEESDNKWVHNVCEVCGGLVFVTLDQWNTHLASRRHQRNNKRVKRKAEKLNDAT